MLRANRNEPAAPKAPRRRFGKLRIAWSVAWGVVAVLLVVLWVRSYWWLDMANSPTSGSHFFLYESICGKLNIGVTPSQNVIRQNFWVFTHEPLEKVAPPTFAKETRETNLDRIGTGWAFRSDGFSVILPHWIFAASVLLLAVAPWFWPERYQLRTLLVATTVVAALLGVIVYLNGRGMN